MKKITTVFITALALSLSGCSDDRTPEEKAESRCKSEIEAFVMSQQLIKRKLKSPSTAEFPYINEDGVSVKYLGECKHLVLGYVDAQNSFGATIRNKYTVIVQNIKGTDSWKLIEGGMN